MPSLKRFGKKITLVIPMIVTKVFAAKFFSYVRIGTSVAKSSFAVSVKSDTFQCNEKCEQQL